MCFSIIDLESYVKPSFQYGAFKTLRHIQKSFKSSYGVESYVKMCKPVSRSQHSLLSHLRSRVLPSILRPTDIATKNRGSDL